MSFNQMMLQDEYESRLERETEYENAINQIIDEYACSWEIAEYMKEHSCDIQEAEEALTDKI